MNDRYEIFTRNSVRAYLEKEIPQDVLQRVIETACKSPSWSNTQPVKVHVVTGEKKRRISAKMVEAAKNGEPIHPDIPLPPNESWPDEMLLRMQEHARERSKFVNIKREDKEKRFQFQLKMYEFFDAPVALFFTLHRDLPNWSLLDVGFAMQNVMIAANMEGLGTCPQVSAVYYPDIVREVLGLDETVKIIVGMAIGYPDTNASINQYRAKRRPVDEMVFWHE